MKVTVFYTAEAIVEVDDKFAEIPKCSLSTQEGYLKWDAMVTELDAFLQTKLPARAEIKFVHSDTDDLYKN